ncbi:MAG: aspartate carbamoyltransferase catalytic subunit, partial [Albidovulum sp.]
GCHMVIGQYFRAARLRRHTRYALTNRRALITSWAGKRSLKSYPIGPHTVIDYQPGTEATIYFATETTTDSDGDKSHERIGFEHVPDGESAYAVIRRIQNGAVE